MRRFPPFQARSHAVDDPQKGRLSASLVVRDLVIDLMQELALAFLDQP